MALALKIGASESTVRKWQNEQKQPTDRELKMIAEALGLTVEELTGKGESQKGD
jgi:ribosome-binding protein aMBF1 (putative translation factor)